MRSGSRFLSLFILAILARAAAAQTAPAAGAADEIRRLADGLHARGMDDLAIPEYQRLIREHPDYPQLDLALFRLAESFRRTGRGPQAEFFYRRLARDYPNSPYRARADLQLGDLLEEAGRTADAAAAFESAMAGEPPPELAAAAGYRLGRARRALGDAGAAERAWRAVLAAAPDTPFASLAAIELSELLDAGAPERRDEAQRLLTVVAASATPETAAEALARLFRRRYERGEFAEAAARFDELQRRFPASAHTAALLRPAAWARLRAGRPADALELARAALDAPAPEAADEWLYLRANAERALPDAAAASESYRLLIERHPDSRFAAAAAREWALLAYQRREYAEAIRRARLVRPTPETDDDIEWLLGESQAALGQSDAALQHFRRLAEASPTGPRAADALYRVGRILQEREDWSGAAAAYRKLAGEHPDHALAPAARAAAAYAFARRDAWTDALAEWTALAERHPDDPLAEEARFRKAAAELRLGRDAAALASFDDLLRRHPATRFEVEARYWRSVLLERRGDAAGAEAELRVAAERHPDPEWSGRIDHRRAALLQRLGRMDEAERLLKRLLETPARADLAPELLEWLARRALEAGDAGAATRAAAPLAGPAAPPTWRPVGAYLLGRAHEAAGRKKEAALQYEIAAGAPALTRDRADALYRWAVLLAEANDLDGAYRRFTELAEQTAGAEALPDLRARALRGLADLAERRGRWDEAARLHTAVAVLFDDPELTPDSLRRAAECFRRLGAEERAEQLLRELAERYPERR